MRLATFVLVIVSSLVSAQTPTSPDLTGQWTGKLVVHAVDFNEERAYEVTAAVTQSADALTGTFEGSEPKGRLIRGRLKARDAGAKGFEGELQFEVTPFGFIGNNEGRNAVLSQKFDCAGKTKISVESAQDKMRWKGRPMTFRDCNGTLVIRAWTWTRKDGTH